MKILWIHNYSINDKISGVFMKILLDRLILDGLKIELYKINSGNIFSIYKLQEYFNLKKISYKYDILHVQYGSYIGFLTSFINHPNKILTLRGSDLLLPKPNFTLKYLKQFFSVLLTLLSFN